MSHDSLETILINQAKLYPKAEIQDYLKLIFQIEFGCGHLLADKEKSLQRLHEEYKQMNQRQPRDSVEIISESFARAHLSVLYQTRLSMETFHRIFELSAGKLCGSQEGFYQKVQVLADLTAKGILKLCADELSQVYSKLKNQPLKPFSHSQIFTETYAPAYRVIERKYIELLPVLEKIDQLKEENKSLIIAIDGDCGSGKTTLAKLLQEIYQASLISIDDFFLQKEQRTAQRLAEIGGNIDYERFNLQVFPALKAGKNFSYQPYNCQKQDFDEAIHIKPRGLTIIEGSYSHHPLFASQYDLKIFLSVPQEIQSRRILKRNGSFLHEKFVSTWIPMEKRYFSAFQIREQSDLQLEILSKEEEEMKNICAL